MGAPEKIRRAEAERARNDLVLPPGYEPIRIRMKVEADCSDEELDDLLAYTQRHSPVCNTVCRPVPLSIERTGARPGPDS